ncbi:MAG: hypothetical protein ABUL64_00985, partial [Singulisphaera sp.]
SFVASVDAPFTAAEIERILRWRDADAVSLPNRLIQLAPLALPLDPRVYAAGTTIRSTVPYPEIAHMPSLITHASFDLPVASMVFSSPDQVDNLEAVHTSTSLGGSNFSPPIVNGHITQLVAARIALEAQPGTFPPTITPLIVNLIDYSISRQLLPPELIGGEKMNLNRPLGNGYDDNNNGIVDEPAEVDYAWSAVTTGGGPNNSNGPSSNTNSVFLDLTNSGLNGNQLAQNNGTVQDNGDHILDGRDSHNILVRQQMARYLYVLMMLFSDHNLRQTAGFNVQADYDGNGTPNEPADTAYYFAQWAINVVDFMDADSIITPFEFDIYPFTDNNTNVSGTWDVDGVVYTQSQFQSAASTYDDKQDSKLVGGGYRGLVWGCERPELVITETLATHDRRTQDTSIDPTSKKVNRNPMANGDLDFDQVRRPQGSLVIELFNPNPPFTTGGVIAGQKPSEMYASAFADPVTSAPQFGVNLAAQYPTSDVPTWRLAVRPRLRVKAQQNLPLRNPVLPPNLTTNGQVNEIDRVLYFTQQPTPMHKYTSEGKLEFHAAPGASAIIPPNHYAVVAPAAPNPYDATDKTTPVLHLGWRDFSQDSQQPDGNGVLTAPNSSIANRYHARIQFSPYVTVWDDIGNQAWPQRSPPIMPTPYPSRSGTPTEVKPCVGIPIATLLMDATYSVLAPTDTNAKWSVRCSVTEPNTGYPVPLTSQVIGGSPYNINDNAYYLQSAIQDKPYDSSASGLFKTTDLDDTQRLNDILGNGSPTAADETITQYTVVYLQRLANPTMRWDARANPYITVDQMWVDLTTYNSEKGMNPGSGNEEFQGMPKTPQFMRFDTRRRAPTAAQMSQGTMLGNGDNVWYHNPTDATLLQLTQPAQGTAITSPIPTSTLGYLNNEYGAVGNNRYTSASGSHPAQIPTLPAGSTGLAVNVSEYRGDPTYPFPWLNWNNRPFVNSKELMLVPLSSPSSLLAEISTSTPSTTTGQTWAGALSPNSPPYQQTATGQPPVPMGEFSHLPNMFHSPAYAYDAGNPNAVVPRTTSQYSPNLYRLLDYVHVPSRFTGTETWLPPAKMMADVNGNDYQDPNASTNNPNGLPVHQFHPPFNRISQFRDPGRVNINTILDPFVWQGVIDDFAVGNDTASSPLWRNLWMAICQSRFGGNLGAANSVMDPAMQGYLRGDLPLQITSATQVPPTIFANPFRSYSGHTLVPVDMMRRQMTTTTPVEREIDATMLRTMPFATPAAGYPLLEYPGSLGNGNYNWIEYNSGVVGVNAHIDDETRNPYFAYKAMRRLDNLLTTRSNVYAVWITLGYFEVTPAPSNDPQRAVKYPDGWVLGQELGADTGDIQRHRAFYMYDRSIPVGFERGENHNVHKGILLERFIE